MDFSINQPADSGIGNFVMCTPTLISLHRHFKAPLPIYLGNPLVKQLYHDWECLRVLPEPGAPEQLLFDTGMIDFEIPDIIYVHETVTAKLGVHPPFIPRPYAPPLNALPGFAPGSYYVVARGCAAGRPWAPRKEAGDRIYRRILETLPAEARVVLIGAGQDAERHLQRMAKWRPAELVLDDIRKSAALVRHAKALICNDTGMYHLAGAYGQNTFILWKDTAFLKNASPGAKCCYSRCGNWERDFDRWLCPPASVPQHPRPAPPNADILIVGVLDDPNSTNYRMRIGFEELGYTVDGFNYRARAKVLGGYPALNGDLLNFLQGKRYQLIIFSKINGMDPVGVQLANRFGKTWYWFMDSLAMARQINAPQYVRACQYASASSQEAVAFLRETLADTAQLIEGFDAQVFKPLPVPVKSYDLIFVGNATPQRTVDLAELMRCGRSIQIFGMGWPEQFRARPAVFGEQFREAVSQARIVLNLVHSNIFSDRVVHSMACGGFVLSQHCPDLEGHFQRGVHLDWFTSLEEFHTLSEQYLARDEERARIAETGCAFVHERYKWRDVCRRMLELAGVAKPHAPTPPWAPAPAPALKKHAASSLIVTWHGLGDNVLLTPALRRYKALHPQERIVLLGLKRFSPILEQLLDGLPFIDEIRTMLPDAWNEFPSFAQGVSAVYEAAYRLAGELGCAQVHILPTERKLGYRLHKIFRFAEELGVEFDRLEDLQPQLSLDPLQLERAKSFVARYPAPYLALHLKGGNPRKTLSEAQAASLLERFRSYTIFEFGGQSTPRSIPVSESDMGFSKALIWTCDRVVAIDSVVMHIAGAFQKPLLAIFTATPIHQAAPLTYPVEITAAQNAETEAASWGPCRAQVNNLYPSRAWLELLETESTGMPSAEKKKPARHTPKASAKKKPSKKKGRGDN